MGRGQSGTAKTGLDKQEGNGARRQERPANRMQRGTGEKAAEDERGNGPDGPQGDEKARPREAQQTAEAGSESTRRRHKPPKAMEAQGGRTGTGEGGVNRKPSGGEDDNRQAAAGRGGRKEGSEEPQAGGSDGKGAGQGRKALGRAKSTEPRPEGGGSNATRDPQGGRENKSGAGTTAQEGEQRAART